MLSIGGFKAVLFDLGGTLVKTVDAPEIYKRILEVYGVKVSVEDIAKAHEENVKEFDIEEMVKLMQDFWVKWNLRFLERIGIQDNRDFLARTLDKLWWEYAELEVYSDVLETLAQLKRRGIKIGIVTNGFENDYRQILRKLNWTDYFDVVVGIDACKKAKPDREIFLFAINKIHVRPEETIFIGDSVKSDYEGSKKAGLRPLLINREGKTLADVKTITSLTEVLLCV